MVRIIFTPKSVENLWVDSVQGEQQFAAEVLFRPGQYPKVYRIALCQDGNPWRGSSSLPDTIEKQFTELFKRWGVNADIKIHKFTFIDNTTEAYEVLVNCDMFYFAGIYCSKLPAPLTNVSLVEILRGRVQCNELCYLPWGLRRSNDLRLLTYVRYRWA